MKIFISHSGERSQALGSALNSFVPKILQQVETWFSDVHIDKGSRSNHEIVRNLDDADGGIVCLTPENLGQPWILYEAGALSRQPVDRVWTVLLDLEYAQVEQPLAQFQHTRARKEEMFRLFQSINALSEKPRPGEHLKTVFEALWDVEVQTEIDRLLQQGRPAGQPAKRPSEAMIEEILELMRRSVFRGDETGLMISNLHQAVLGRTPSLADLMVERSPRRELALRLALAQGQGMLAQGLFNHPLTTEAPPPEAPKDDKDAAE